MTTYYIKSRNDKKFAMTRNRAEPKVITFMPSPV